MIQAGMGDAVGACAAGDPVALAHVEDATTWRRLDPFVVSGLAALGLTPEQGDDLFREAMRR